MVQRKTFIDKLCREMAEKQPHLICKNMSKIVKCVSDLDKLNEESKHDSKCIFLVGWNPDTECLFLTYNVNRNDVLMIIQNGQSMIHPCKNIDYLYLSKIVDSTIDATCKICFDNLKLFGSRACEKCREIFCVACQIHFVIQGFTNGTYAMECPFCRYEHPLGSDDIFYDMTCRIQMEKKNGNISAKEAKKLQEFLHKSLSNLDTDSD